MTALLRSFWEHIVFATTIVAMVFLLCGLTTIAAICFFELTLVLTYLNCTFLLAMLISATTLVIGSGLTLHYGRAHLKGKGWPI